MSALARPPFEETLYLDCDILLFSDPEGWFEVLGTDDFTFFPAYLDPEVVPDQMQMNLVNPHRMREQFGFSRTAVSDGGGHFFLRRTERARQLLGRVVEIMDEAAEQGPRSLYHRMTGEGNLVASDEPAASIMMAECGVKLPEEDHSERPRMQVYMPPCQREENFVFEEMQAEFFCGWKGRRVQPGAVHFCAGGKHHPAYQAWVAAEALIALRL